MDTRVFLEEIGKDNYSRMTWELVAVTGGKGPKTLSANMVT